MAEENSEGMGMYVQGASGVGGWGLVVLVQLVQDCQSCAPTEFSLN